MRIFLTGGSGFIGRHVARELLARGHGLVALTRTGELPFDATPVRGTLDDPAALRAGLERADACVHLVGVIDERGGTFERVHVEGTRVVLAACAGAGVGRYLHMSALGARPDAPSRYHRTKWAAEELVRASGTAWTVFRPSMIVGRDGAFVRQAVAWAKGEAFPFVAMPYFGRGALGRGEPARVQPVTVGDVARAFAAALEKVEAQGRVFNVAGPEAMTWPRFYERLARAHGVERPRTLAVPAWYAKLVARVTPARLLPYTLDQVRMAEEDNVGDATELAATLGVRAEPIERAFAPGGPSLSS